MNKHYLINPIRAFAVGAALLGAASVANAISVYQVTGSVDPVTGWNTNGNILEAINCGPSDTSGGGGNQAANVTVNGISFIASGVTNADGGGAGYAHTYSFEYGCPAWSTTGSPIAYTGSDPDVINMYSTWDDNDCWSYPDKNVYTFPVVTAGHTYRVQMMGWPGWDWASETFKTSSDGGVTYASHNFGGHPQVLYSITYTWDADDVTNTGVIDIEDTGGQIMILAYTFADLSVGPPTIFQNTAVTPGNVVYAGNTVTFSADAYGQLPLSYQWRTNSVPIPGATGKTYQIPSATVADSAVYDVVITNSLGTTNGSAITLTVNPAVAPFITSAPVGGSVLQHASFNLTAGIGGTTPIKYQWKLNGTNFPGATNTTLSLVNIDPAWGGTYVLNATNAFGSTNTDPVTLTVIPDLVLNPTYGVNSNPNLDDWLVIGGNTFAIAGSEWGSFCQINGGGNGVCQQTSGTFKTNKVYTLIAELKGMQNGTFNIEDATGGTNNQASWILVSTVTTTGFYNGMPWAPWTNQCYLTASSAASLGVNEGDPIGIRFVCGNDNLLIAEVQLIESDPVGPQLINIVRTNDTVTCGVNFLPYMQGVSFALQSSSNLLSWSTINGTVTSLDTNVINQTFTDPAASGSKAFYRLIQQ